MIFVRGARQLVTLRGRGPRRGIELSNLEVIADGSMLIENGVIVEVGSTRRIENLAAAKGARVIDASGKVVMPGFVDCHTRPAFAAPLLRDFESRAVAAYGPEQDPPPQATSAALDPSGLSSAVISARARRWMRAFAGSGTTTVDARCGFGLNLRLDLKVLRAMKAQDDHPIEVTRTYSLAPAIALADSRNSDDLAELVAENVQKICVEQKLATSIEAEYSPPGIPPQLVSSAIRQAKLQNLTFRLQTHRLSASDGVQLATSQGAATVEHLLHASDSDINLMAESVAVAVLFPGYVFHRAGQRYPPARRLIDLGAAVALASGFGPQISPGSSMALVTAIACRKMRMLPEEAIAATTINGAAALGISHKTGSLEPGKQADVAIYDVADYREIPYYFGINLCVLTMKKGFVIYPAAVSPAPKRPTASEVHKRRQNVRV